MESAAKRCHYEVLGLSRDCTADEIRSAYKKLALQRHPDKLVQSGLSHAEATAQFQELAQAYEVLSDPKERAWYDSHRSQILFSDLNSNSVAPNSAIPNLFSFFSNTVFSGYSDSGRGFYKVYSDLFDKIYANEINFSRKLGLALNKEAPLMGNLESPYVQVTAFYNYWLGFCTVMDFCWADQYDAMAGVNRKSRRVMEEENKKVRKKARREYNETVRGLAEFVKKRDKRVIDMAVKRNLEMERKKEEERERKKRLEKERIEKAKAYVEPEWTRVDEEDLEGDGKGMEEEEEEEEEEGRKRKEFYCVVCGKKFKSDKQWKNHEQSKKHKEKVAEFRDSLGDEEDVAQDIGEEEERVVDEVGERIREELEIGDKDEEDEENVGGFHDVEDKNEVGGGEESDGDGVDDDDDDDDEMGVLEAMVAGRKSRKNVGSRSEEKAAVWSEVRAEDESDGVELPKSRNNVGSRREEKAAAWSEVRVEDESDGVDFMEYNNTKSKRKNRRSKKKGGEATRDVTDEINRQSEEGESNGHDHSNLEEEESSSHSVVENESNGNGNGNVKGGDQLARDKKSSNQHVDKKGAGKKDTNAKSKNSSKGKKSKATSKNSSNTCDTCGDEFESRSKLHKHLGESGHATLKSAPSAMETCLMKCSHGSALFRAIKPLSLKLPNSIHCSSTAIHTDGGRWTKRAYDTLLLDAGGTLLQLAKPVEEIYATIGSKYGLSATSAEIKQGFRRAFAATWPEKLRYQGDGRPFWKLVVSEATGCADNDYFEEVYEYYAKGDAWHLPDGAYETITLLKDAGVKIAVVSNFDTRLRKLLKDLNVLDLFDAVIISSEVGYEKPDIKIFKAALDQVNVEACKAVHVGDDQKADKDGANAIGIDCWLWGIDVKTFSDIGNRILISEL